MNDAVEHVKSLEDHVAMLKRRKLALLIPTLIAIVVAVLLAFGLPATYQSQATILIQQQAIPRDFMRSTVTSFAAQQIQTISARVLTVRNISQIVEKFNLYDQNDVDVKSRLPGTELALLFRENMDMEMVSADVIDPKSGKPTEVTIAFTLSFKSPSSTTAQKVTSELVTLFLNENLGIRATQAESTEEFFITEAARLSDEIKEQEERLAEFKAKNEGSLPELYQYNLGALERTERQLSDTKLRIQQLDIRKLELAAQLAQLSPSAPVIMSSGQVVLSNEDRLKALQSDYRRKAAIYSADHPDVVRLEREIQALQSELGVETDVDDIRQQLQEQKRRLAELQTKYTSDHQDIRNSQQLIALLESRLRELGNSGPSSADAPKPDNPAYILLDTQLAAAETERSSLVKKLDELQEKYDRYDEMIKRTPIVEKDYEALMRDYQSATRKYQDILNNTREAGLSKSLEQSRKGERFILIEPPARPADPISPNRPAIIFLGLVFGVGAGLGTALLREALDGSIHGMRELTSIMGEPAFVAIPYLENEEDMTQQQRLRKAFLVGGLAVSVLLVLYLHFFYIPLDVMYFSVLNKLGFN